MYVSEGMGTRVSHSYNGGEERGGGATRNGKSADRRDKSFSAWTICKRLFEPNVACMAREGIVSQDDKQTDKTSRRCRCEETLNGIQRS